MWDETWRLLQIIAVDKWEEDIFGVEDGYQEGTNYRGTFRTQASI